MNNSTICWLLWAVCVGIGSSVPAAANDNTAGKVAYAIVIHGGALDAPEELGTEVLKEYENGLNVALQLGRKTLDEGGTALDAVERVIRALEDDPTFNAGRGAVYNVEGKHELDASIMDGSNRACGAVSNVRTVKNPISLARLVMSKTRHVLLVSDGAEQFATEMKVDRVEPSYFDTKRQYENWIRVRERQAKEGKKGTVGCVALDKLGNLAAGTSTGGLTNKKFGRVGDSPIIGAGTYADNATCGVSCTGTGEEFIRNAVAHDVAARMSYLKISVSEAARQVVQKVLRPDDGALIALSHDGEITAEYNTAGLARGAADSTGRFEVKLYK